MELYFAQGRSQGGVVGAAAPPLWKYLLLMSLIYILTSKLINLIKVKLILLSLSSMLVYYQSRGLLRT